MTIMNLPIPEYIQSIVPYPPGKPLDELERQYGVKNAIKLASNENPWGPSPKAIVAIREALANLHRYPDGSSYNLTQALAKKLDCAPEMLVFGNGSNEMIEFLTKALITPGDEAVSSFPSFLMYQKFVQIRGGRNIVLPLKDMRHDLAGILAKVTDRTRLIFLDNPNNPSGTAFAEAAFADFLGKLPETVVVALDEAYVDFADPKTRLDSFRIRPAGCVPAHLFQGLGPGRAASGLRRDGRGPGGHAPARAPALQHQQPGADRRPGCPG